MRRSGSRRLLAVMVTVFVAAQASAASAAPQAGRYLDADRQTLLVVGPAGARLHLSAFDCTQARATLARTASGDLGGVLRTTCVDGPATTPVRVRRTADRRVVRLTTGGVTRSLRRSSARFGPAARRCRAGRTLAANAALRVGEQFSRSTSDDAASAGVSFVCLRAGGPRVVVASSDFDGVYSSGTTVLRAALAGRRAAFVLTSFDELASKLGEEGQPQPRLLLVDPQGLTRRSVALGSVVVDELVARADGAAAWFSRPAGSAAGAEQQVVSVRGGELVTLATGTFVPGSLRVQAGEFAYTRR